MRFALLTCFCASEIFFLKWRAPFRQSYCLLKRHAASKEKYISPVLFEINQ